MSTMAKTAKISTRIEPELKTEGEEIFSSLGVSTSDAISIFFRQVVMHKGFPFDVKIPNKETVKALKEDLSNAKRFNSVDELMEDLRS